ncbi:MAG: hypothetical protein JST76_08000 [Bacteroidetes bacterium]|nr:hypothetical protein [Bacteroidota bacterium]
MAFNFHNLNLDTRKAMLEELQRDVDTKVLYLSKRFNNNGVELYPNLLKVALEDGTEVTLSGDLNANNCFKEFEDRIDKKTGSVKAAKVPITASQMFAEGEFNRFYIRAICLLAIDKGQKIEVYRARHSDNPRPDSEVLIGKQFDPSHILNDLRANIGIDTILGLPAGPNSGLSIKLV